MRGEQPCLESSQDNCREGTLETLMIVVEDRFVKKMHSYAGFPSSRPKYLRHLRYLRLLSFPALAN